MRLGAHLPAIAMAAVLLIACGPSTGGSTGASTATPTPTTSALPTPSATPAATPSLKATPAAAGLTAKQAAEQVAKKSGVACMTTGPHPVWMGQGAAVFSYAGGPCGPGAHFAFFAYVDQDVAGWHPRNWAGTQNASVPGVSLPGSPFTFTLSRGCLNVHSAPGLAASVVACLASGTNVETSGKPVYKDGHIWWRILTGNFSSPTGTTLRGWSDHDLLLCDSSPTRASYC